MEIVQNPACAICSSHWTNGKSTKHRTLAYRLPVLRLQGTNWKLRWIGFFVAANSGNPVGGNKFCLFLCAPRYHWYHQWRIEDSSRCLCTICMGIALTWCWTGQSDNFWWIWCEVTVIYLTSKSFLWLEQKRNCYNCNWMNFQIWWVWCEILINTHVLEQLHFLRHLLYFLILFNIVFDR